MPYNSTTHAVEARLPLHVVNCLIALLNTHARVGSPVERTFLPTSCVYGITITRHSDGSRVAFSALWGICHAATAAGHSGAPLHGALAVGSCAVANFEDSPFERIRTSDACK